MTAQTFLATREFSILTSGVGRWRMVCALCNNRPEIFTRSPKVPALATAKAAALRVREPTGIMKRRRPA